MNADEISRKVMDAASAVGDKAVGLIEEGKLLYKIREAERGIEKVCGKIGRYLYDNNRELLDGPLSEQVEKIDVLQAQLTSLRREYAQVRNMKFCENCGSLNKENSQFCDQCGEGFY